jgi:hypothetical protein
VTNVLPPGLIEFIRRCIPTLRAAEVLLFLAAHPNRRFLPDEIVVGIQPVVVTASAVREYADLFLAARLLTEVDGKIGYSPSQSQADEVVRMLSSAYNEFPVTLITEIHRIADSKLQSFSDSFRLRREKP